MACSGGGGCQSNGCQKIDESKLESINQRNTICLKCKIKQVIAPGVTSEDGRYCADCFRSNLFGKFRFAVTSNAMISPTDRVLVAFSGGPSSRVALQYVHDMQQKAQHNFDASPDRSLPVFGVGVAFVDESCVNTVSSGDINNAIKMMESIVVKLAPPAKKFHVVPIENVYASDSSSNKERMNQLVEGVSDVTGKEDLILHLRMLSLQKIAREEGYSKIILGSCTSQIACHVLSSTVKGRGYSLSADIQYVDSRRDIPVVLPLRDCFAQEINILCRLDGLQTVELPTSSCSSINSLVSSFVKLLQEENPSRESTIVRTAGKLIPFHFNKTIESLDSDIHLPSRLRKKFNVKSEQSIPTESFCPICVCPLKKEDIPNQKDASESQATTDDFSALCCYSCRFQILPSELDMTQEFRMQLPHCMAARGVNDSESCLRESIKDWLL